MIQLDVDAALFVAGFVTVIAVAWGAFLSVRSAANGPEWAFDHLMGIRRVWPGLALLGVAAMAVFSPVWVGLSALYVVAGLWFLSASLLRNLHRLRELDGFVDIGPERRSVIVRRARRLLLGGGIVMIVLGLVLTQVGVVGWIGFALGAVLLVTALVLGSNGSAAE